MEILFWLLLSCFIVLYELRSQEWEDVTGAGGLRKEEVWQSPLTVGQWVETKLLGNCPVAPKIHMRSVLTALRWGRPVHTVLSFSPANSAAWMQVLRFNMVGGFAKGVQIHNPFIAFLEFRKFWKLIVFCFVLVGLANFCGGNIWSERSRSYYKPIRLYLSHLVEMIHIFCCRNIHVFDFSVLSQTLLGHLCFIHCLILLKS